MYNIKNCGIFSRKVFPHIVTGNDDKQIIHDVIVKESKLLCIGTTFSRRNVKLALFVELKDTLAMKVQEHMIQGLLELGPSVAPVIFSNEEYYQRFCGDDESVNSDSNETIEKNATSTQSRITCISDFQTNPFHLPYIRSFFSKPTDLPYTCQFYGYVNGDILLSPQILDILNETLHQIAIGAFSPHVLVVGRRTNYPWANVTSLASGENYRTQLRSFCSADSPYMSNAIVAFIHTQSHKRTTFYSLPARLILPIWRESSLDAQRSTDI